MTEAERLEVYKFIEVEGFTSVETITLEGRPPYIARIRHKPDGSYEVEGVEEHPLFTSVSDSSFDRLRGNLERLQAQPNKDQK